MKRLLPMLALVLAISAPAPARDATGALHTLLVPNSGLPACVVPGDAFEILARTESGKISLEQGAASVSLEVRESILTGQAVRLTCDVPQGTASGAWALRVGDDVNLGAVFVLPERPQTYSLAFLSLHAGMLPDAAVLGAAAEAGAALLVVTAVQEAFAPLVPILDAAPLPVVVCPPAEGPREFARYFGPVDTGFRYGPDGFIRFSAAVGPTLEDVGGEDAALQRWQRVLRPCRWRIGLADRIDASMGLRRQFVLFVDAPLDYCLVRESGFAPLDAPIHKTPWGRTVVGVPPTGAETPFELVVIDDAGLRRAEAAATP